MSRTVYLRDSAQAAEALAQGHDIRFLTPPDGAFTAGESYYRAVLASLGRPVDAIIDCADDAAVAVEALNAGWRGVVLRGPAAPAVAAIAKDLGATLYRRAPRAIELPDPSRL
ncbi:MAG: hypothetical protein RIM84_00045 [Alphaproteobacteria bacterium]